MWQQPTDETHARRYTTDPIIADRHKTDQILAHIKSKDLSKDLMYIFSTFSKCHCSPDNSLFRPGQHHCAKTQDDRKRSAGVVVVGAEVVVGAAVVAGAAVVLTCIGAEEVVVGAEVIVVGAAMVDLVLAAVVALVWAAVVISAPLLDSGCGSGVSEPGPSVARSPGPLSTVVGGCGRSDRGC